MKVRDWRPEVDRAMQSSLVYREENMAELREILKGMGKEAIDYIELTYTIVALVMAVALFVTAVLFVVHLL